VRLWIDIEIGQDDARFCELIDAVVAAPFIELVGVSVVTNDLVVAQEVAHPSLRDRGVGEVLLYSGAPDPRALDAAEALLAVGPLTNLARLARHSIELPPLVVVEECFCADPIAAALVVATASDVLVLPADRDNVSPIAVEIVALCALTGRHVVVGKRFVGVELDGTLVIATTDDAGDLTERDVVVDCDYHAMAAAISQ
jgi:hypothetical protein